jgi:hypothetical protein
MKRFFLFVISLITITANAQDVAFARKMVDTLASRTFWGRGYTEDGLQKAAGFLAAQFSSYGLKPMGGKTFLQPFSHPVNTFPGKMDVVINGKSLVPGKDFIVSPESRGARSRGALERIDSVQYMNPKERVVIKMEDKLTWSVASGVEDYTVIQVAKSALDDVPQSFRVQIENKFLPSFAAANVCGLVEGTAKPDSIILITAHYDHLGGMGSDTYFPGANDNASGVALLLNLARYYAKHPQRYSIGFILFAGEEAGLLGSKYFTEPPLAPLKKIRFVLNTDLAGTGEEGITVVNATEYPAEFAALQRINEQSNLLAAVNARGKAANSDHYFFTEKGIPAFFFYTLGGIKAYHDIFDRPETLPLTEHEDLFKLVVSFTTYLMEK